jgi:hypothetical protein
MGARKDMPVTTATGTIPTTGQAETTIPEDQETASPIGTLPEEVMAPTAEETTIPEEIILKVEKEQNVPKDHPQAHMEVLTGTSPATMGNQKEDKDLISKDPKERKGRVAIIINANPLTAITHRKCANKTITDLNGPKAAETIITEGRTTDQAEDPSDQINELFYNRSTKSITTPRGTIQNEGVLFFERKETNVTNAWNYTELCKSHRAWN